MRNFIADTSPQHRILISRGVTFALLALSLVIGGVGEILANIASGASAEALMTAAFFGLIAFLMPGTIRGLVWGEASDAKRPAYIAPTKTAFLVSRGVTAVLVALAIWGGGLDASMTHIAEGAYLSAVTSAINLIVVATLLPQVIRNLMA
jgi:hypothetical protein